MGKAQHAHQTVRRQSAPAFADFEMEEAVFYGDAERRLQKGRLEYRSASRPQQFLHEQVRASTAM